MKMMINTSTVVWHICSKSWGPGPISRATRENVVRACISSFIAKSHWKKLLTWFGLMSPIRMEFFTGGGIGGGILEEVTWREVLTRCLLSDGPEENEQVFLFNEDWISQILRYSICLLILLTSAPVDGNMQDKKVHTTLTACRIGEKKFAQHF